MDTIKYKVVVCDIATNDVYIIDIACPYYDVDEVDAFDIADLNTMFVENYIENEMGLNLDFVTYTIFSDAEKVEVYGEKNKHIVTIE